MRFLIGALLSLLSNDAKQVAGQFSGNALASVFTTFGRLFVALFFMFYLSTQLCLVRPGVAAFRCYTIQYVHRPRRYRFDVHVSFVAQ